MDVFLDLDWGSEILDDITFETVLNVWNNTKKGEEVKELHINTFFQSMNIGWWLLIAGVGILILAGAADTEDREGQLWIS